MPKLQKSEEQIKTLYLTGVIKKYQAVAELPANKLAPKVRIPLSTLHQKIREPWRFTYDELYMIFKVLHIPANEVLQCFSIKEEDTA